MNKIVRPTNLDLPFAITSQSQVIYNLWGGCIIILESILIYMCELNKLHTQYTEHQYASIWPSKLTNYFSNP